MKQYWKKAVAAIAAIALVACLGVVSGRGLLKADEDAPDVSETITTPDVVDEQLMEETPTEEPSDELTEEQTETPEGEALDEETPAEENLDETAPAEETVEEKASEEEASDAEAVDKKTADEEIDLEAKDEAESDEEEVDEKSEDEEEDEEEEEEEKNVYVTSSLDGVALAEEGTPVVLTAYLTGYDKETYVIQWQKSFDGETWVDETGANGLTYTFPLTVDTQDYVWRAVVTTVN